MEPRVISDPTSFSEFNSSLASAGLPCEDLNFSNHLLIGYYDAGKMIGTGGLETYGSHGLLRSVSIDKNIRGQNLGTRIALHLIDKAKSKDLEGIYLLTETAKEFFTKLGFKVIDRDEAPAEIKSSSEFAHVCPSTAVCMYLDLRLC